MKLKVSIIIPTYKSWGSLRKCLIALHKQTYQGDFEILVVNNESDDVVPNDLLLYKNVKFLHESKPGSYAARNKGLSVAKGEIIAFTDADCLPNQQWLRNGINHLETKPDIGVVAGNVILFYLNPKKLNCAETYEKYTAFKIREYVFFGNCVTANWFSYKKTLDDFGRFDESLKSGGDSALSQEISKSLPIIFAEDTIVYHPARNRISDIITKNKRLFGGRFTKSYKNKSKISFLQYVADYLYRRMKFNLNILLKGEVKDFFMILNVHFFLLPAVFFEALKLVNNGKIERR